MDSLISVIVPAYNAERFIERTLDSALGQSYRDLEIVVVDDGSTDRTADIVAAVAARDPRVKLIRAANRGPGAARNRAIAESRGELIAPLDNDDLWRPDKLAKQADMLARAPPGTGVVYCWSVGIDEDDRIVFPAWSNGTAVGNVLRAMIATSLCGNGSAPLIRRACVEAVSGYDARFFPGEDWPFYVALAAHTEFAVVPEYLTGYRLRSHSASTDIRRMDGWRKAFRAWLLERWPDLPKDLLRRHDWTVAGYLSFSALRNGDLWLSLRWRARAWRARPATIFHPDSLGFLLLLVVGRVWPGRYGWPPWRRPRPFLNGP
jgi:glycosyltransferase involved in cell wall biosynthesis